MRGVLDAALTGAGFEINGSYLTLTQSSQPTVAPSGTASTSSNPQDGNFLDSIASALGLTPGQSALGASLGTVALLVVGAIVVKKLL
jgi:hypothetical protein